MGQADGRKEDVLTRGGLADKKSDEGIVGGNPEGRNVRRDVVNEGYLAYRRRQNLYT